MRNLSNVTLSMILGLTVISTIGCQSNEKDAVAQNQSTSEAIHTATLKVQTDNIKTANDANTASKTEFDDSNYPVYKVALNSTYAPFEFKDEQGSIVGYDVELIKAIASEENFKVEIINSQFDQVLNAIDTHKSDIAISAMKLNDSRQDRFLASEPYFQTHEGFVVRQDSDIHTLADLSGHKVAVLGDSHQHQKLEAVDAANVDVTDIVTEPTIFLAFKDIFMDKADAVYSEEPILHFEASQYPENPVRFIPSELGTNKYVIYTNKDNQDLMLKINHGLQTLKANGRYHEITQKWFGSYSAQSEIL